MTTEYADEHFIERHQSSAKCPGKEVGWTLFAFLMIFKHVYCTSPSSFSHLCVSYINRVCKILLMVYGFVLVLCPIIPFSQSLICTCDIFRAQRQINSRRAFEGSLCLRSSCTTSICKPAMKSSRSIRIVRCIRRTSVELSWTDEWMCAINLTGMTYDTMP